MSDEFNDLAQLSDSNRYVGHGNFSDHTVLLGTGQSMITDLENCAYMIRWNQNTHHSPIPLGLCSNGGQTDPRNHPCGN